MARNRLTLVVYADAVQPTLGEIGLFLYDLATLYELLRLALDPTYDEYRFEKYPLYRGRRPVKPVDQLRVERITVHRQIQLRASVARSRVAADALDAIVSFIRSVDDAKIAARLHARGAVRHVATVVRRLNRSPIRIARLFVEQDGDKKSSS